MKHMNSNLYFLVLSKPVPAQVTIKLSFCTSDKIVTLYTGRPRPRTSMYHYES